MSGHSKFTFSVIAGVISSAIYGAVIAFANLALDQHWPFSAWATIGVGALTMGGALLLQRAQQRRLKGELSKWIGLEEATGLGEYERELDPSAEHPREKLDTIKFSFAFMGNGGSKWTRQEKKMREMLERIGNAGHKTRMLLLNPVCDVCTEGSKELHGEADVIPRRIIESLWTLDRLRKDFPHLEVKTYDHTPYFRLTFVDERAAVVGHYKQYREDSAYSPLMIWEAAICDWSFYWAFRNYFEAEWEDGDPVTKDRLRVLNEEVGQL